MTTRGYARVSTSDQTTEPQRLALAAAGIGQVAEETISGAVPAARRPVLARLLAELAPGDTLAVARLDRLGRDPADVLVLARDLTARGVGLRLLDLGVDTRTPAGGLLLAMLAAVAGWERAVLIERTHAGLDAARARGALLGRRPRLTEAQVAEARRLLAEGRPVAQVARLFRASRSSVYRALERHAALL